jgi:hypothetical protein
MPPRCPQDAQFAGGTEANALHARALWVRYGWLVYIARTAGVPTARKIPADGRRAATKLAGLRIHPRFADGEPPPPAGDTIWQGRGEGMSLLFLIDKVLVQLWGRLFPAALMRPLLSWHCVLRRTYACARDEGWFRRSKRGRAARRRRRPSLVASPGWCFITSGDPTLVPGETSRS